MRQTRFFLIYTLFLLVSCARNIEQERRITVTIEPQRFFAEQLAGDLFEITTLVPPGFSPETYDPTAQQMAQLAHSRAYFAIGQIGFENVWLHRLKENNPQIVFYDNSEGVEWIEDDDHHHHEHEGHHHGSVDPHTWASPKEVRIIVKNMCKALIELDAENAETYQSCLNELLKKIDQMDSFLKDSLVLSGKSFIIYHPALTYLARDYGMKQYAIENEGKEPSPEQLKQLVDRVKQENIRAILIQQEFDKKNAELLMRETGCRLEIINPLEYHWEEEMFRIAKILADE